MNIYPNGRIIILMQTKFHFFPQLSFLLANAFKINCYILMSFYIILDTLKEIVSKEKLLLVICEYETENDLLPIPFTGCPYVILKKQKYYCHQG